MTRLSFINRQVTDYKKGIYTLVPAYNGILVSEDIAFIFLFVQETSYNYHVAEQKIFNFFNLDLYCFLHLYSHDHINSTKSTLPLCVSQHVI